MQAKTIPQAVHHAATKFNKRDAFKHKVNGRYVDVSHADFIDQVYHAALGLGALNLAKGDRVAILSENRVEWAVADVAMLSAGCINVPIYGTLPPNQVEYILNDSEARAIFVSNDEHLETILGIRDRLPKLQAIISFDPQCDSAKAMPLGALIDRGRMVDPKPTFEELIATVGPYDWASIIYTSGTTGNPKGVILTHWNFMSNVWAGLSVIDVTPKDRCLSFLPLCHALERMAGHFLMMSCGATIAYAESVDTVADNLGEVSPTAMISVPRLYEKMYARIMEKVESGPAFRRKMFFWAAGVGKAYAKEAMAGKVSFGTKRKLGVANTLVFSKLKARTGGKLRFFISGGAPLARHINEFFYAAGLPILEGYGLTETSPLISVNTFEDFRFGTVGKPAPGVEVRIAEDGEIVCRGDNVMQGYFKRPDETNEVLRDGWFHTGDIGRMDDGFVTITDRKKDIIITGGGKNVAPQPIEGKLKQSKFIAEAVLIGDQQRFIVALFTPDPDVATRWATEHGLSTDLEKLVDNDDFRANFQHDVDKVNATLAPYEQIKAFSVLTSEFTVEDGSLTPTMKVKRRVVEKRHAELIESLYAMADKSFDHN